MKQTITINGTAYPFRLTIGAMVDYKRMTGEDFSQFRGDDMEKLGIIIYCAIRSACRGLSRLGRQNIFCRRCNKMAPPRVIWTRRHGPARPAS